MLCEKNLKNKWRKFGNFQNKLYLCIAFETEV